MFNPDIHHRQSIRLRGFDYSADGAYFVTLCTQGRECLLGEITNGEMVLNAAGRMVREWWQKLPERFPHVLLDAYAIMPNHFHGIIVIVGAAPCGRPPLAPFESVYEIADTEQPNSKPGRPHGVAPTLGRVVGWFKTMTTNAYIQGVNQSNWPPFPGRLWQRDYFERIIRDEKEMSAVSEYIVFNPMRWADDKENPDYASTPMS